MPTLNSTYNVKDYGAIGNGSADDTAAFEAALADMTAGLSPGQAAGILFVPSGTYWISRTLHFQHPLILQGVGGHNNASVLFFYGPLTDGVHPSIAGIVIEASAIWSCIRDIGLRGWMGLPGDPPADDDRLLSGDNISGIIMRSSAHLSHCDVNGFLHDGIHINSTDTNANSWGIHTCWLRSNGRHGLFVGGGGDNGGGNCIGLMAIANRRYGVYESSFLGNTYLGCHAEGNAGGSYVATSGSACNVFLGCYSEGDQHCAIRYPNMIIGGKLGSALSEKLEILPGMGYPTVISNEGYWNRVHGSIGSDIRILTYQDGPSVHLDIENYYSTVLIQGGESEVTLTLPPIDRSNENLLRNSFGRPYLIKNIGKGRVTIRARETGIKIDNSLNVVLSPDFDYVTLVADYTQWYIVGRN